MAKTAVMVRLSENELSALDAMALKNGISRATCATSILRQRLNAPSLTQQRMSPAGEPDGQASACKAEEPGSTPGPASTRSAADIVKSRMR